LEARDGRSLLASVWLARVVSLGGGVVIADREDDIQAWIQSRRTGAWDKVADFGRPFGDGKYVIPALGLAYACGRLVGNDRASRTALLGLESVAVSGAITGAVKFLAHKHRPSSGAADDIPWDGPGLVTSDLSFPSGHSAVAFAVATVFAAEYSEHRLVAPLAYGAATLCAFSRMNDNAHYLSDVVVGAAIGHFTARAILARHGRFSESRLRLAPTVSARGPGLSISCRF
jgi:membrane-associated phospholipid phosphatase